MSLQNYKYASIEIEQIVDTRLSEKSRYYRNRSRGNKKPLWMLTLVTPPQEYRKGFALSAYLNSLEGALTVINLPNPIPELKSNTGLSVNAPRAIGATSINIGDFTPNADDVCLAGDFIQFANHSKVYQIVSDSSANAFGKADITITPPLQHAISATESISYGDNVIFQVCLDDSVPMSISAANSKMISHTIELMEQG